MDRTKIGSQSYVGDSVVGERCNLEAGTKTISLSPDGKSVAVTIGNERVDTGKVKLGALIGDDVETGVKVTIMPGVKIGVNMRVESGVVVYRDISSDVHVRTRWDARDTCGASV